MVSAKKVFVIIKIKTTAPLAMMMISAPKMSVKMVIVKSLATKSVMRPQRVFVPMITHTAPMKQKELATRKMENVNIRQTMNSVKIAS